MDKTVVLVVHKNVWIKSGWSVYNMSQTPTNSDLPTNITKNLNLH